MTSKSFPAARHMSTTLLQGVCAAALMASPLCAYAVCKSTTSDGLTYYVATVDGFYPPSPLSPSSAKVGEVIYTATGTPRYQNKGGAWATFSCNPAVYAARQGIGAPDPSYIYPTSVAGIGIRISELNNNRYPFTPLTISSSGQWGEKVKIIVELIKLASLIITLNKSVACAERVSGVLAVPTTMNYPAKGGAAKKVTGDAAVTFKNVSFTYAGAGAESLSDISFTAKRGQTIGIIGGTGSGKSTLVSLISRFYDATSGDVMVDGENVKNYTKEELCNKVGVVQQRAVLFKGSIRDNMKWGKEDATDAEIWEALTTAQAKEVVEGKQDQLDFMLEQNGKNLSGGQKQRLSIARALVKKPEILILDDSSSALDFATDAKLRKAVHNLEGNTTTFLVSQRIAGIRQADQILVLGNGTLEGNGTHDELMKTCEVYREIYFSQFPEERAAYNNESGVIA